MRWGEVFALRRENVDLKDKVLTVAGGITRTAKGVPVLGSPGTSHKAQSRDVPIGNLVRAVLVSHVKDLEPDELLFPDAKGGLMRASNWRRREWIPALETAGLAEISRFPASTTYAD
jgi:integrase